MIENQNLKIQKHFSEKDLKLIKKNMIYLDEGILLLGVCEEFD